MWFRLKKIVRKEAQRIITSAQFSTNERVKNINSRPLRGDICNYVLKNTSRQLLFRRVQTRFVNFYPKRKRSRLLFNLCLITVASCLSPKLWDKVYGSNINRIHFTKVASKICKTLLLLKDGGTFGHESKVSKRHSAQRSTDDRKKRAIQYNLAVSEQTGQTSKGGYL